VSKHVPKLGCAFYRTAGGDEPVREWLRALDADVCATIGKDVPVHGVSRDERRV